MKKKSQKKFIFSCLLFILLFSFNIAQGQSLEINYPGFSPTTTKNLLPEYFKYIYTFVIMGAGMTALWYLIEAGWQYLTSAGNPEKLKTARDQIVAVFWGTILLLSSYLILRTINPQLTVFTAEEIVRQMIVSELPPEPPSAPPVYTNYLWRISEITNTVKNIIESQEKGIKKTSQELYSLTSKCNCQNSRPMCLCQQYMGGSCSAVYCYSTKSTEPCPDDAKIKETQQNIIASLFEILYYKNRTVAEREDFLLQIQFLDKEIAHYQEEIAAEQVYLQQTGSPTSQQKIEFLENERAKAEQKKALFGQLEKKLNELSNLIAEFAASTDRISNLPDGIPEEKILGCQENIEKQCQGTCRGGCHDARECSPVKCSGGNPCPINEISAEKGKIDASGAKIISVCDTIIQIVSSIIVIK